MSDEQHSKRLITGVVAIDVEMNKPHNEVIQVGVCWGNVKTGDVIKTRSWLVATAQPIDPFIQRLTGISEADMLDAKPLSIVMGEFNRENKVINEEHNIFMNPLTWGGEDSVAIRKQLPQWWHNTNEWPFGRRWIDVKTVFISMRVAQGLPIQAGLAKAMTKLGLTFIGSKHNAEADALNTFKIYCELLKRFKYDN